MPAHLLLTAGTPLARSRIPLSDWVTIAWLIVLGIAAQQQPTLL
jgi:hypothetical protein